MRRIDLRGRITPRSPGRGRGVSPLPLCGMPVRTGQSEAVLPLVRAAQTKKALRGRSASESAYTPVHQGEPG